MICPKCKTEYREGFYRCADCNIALVEESETQQESFDENSSDLVPALETMDSTFLSDVVAIIEDQNIPYLLQSGTAIGMDADSPNQPLEWRAVLYAFKNSLEAVESIIEKVRENRRNQPAEAQPEED